MYWTDGTRSACGRDSLLWMSCARSHHTPTTGLWRLQQACGYHGEGSIHFANAYYPEIFSKRVEVWKGDVFAGSVGIDSSSGLLKINHGGDFGPMEWYGERTDSVFSSLDPDSVMLALSHYCLDEGRGVYDSSRPLNVEVAFEDVIRSEDPNLQEAISESKSVMPLFP